MRNSPYLSLALATVIALSSAGCSRSDKARVRMSLGGPAGSKRPLRTAAAKPRSMSSQMGPLSLVSIANFTDPCESSPMVLTVSGPDNPEKAFWIFPTVAPDFFSTFSSGSSGAELFDPFVTSVDITKGNGMTFTLSGAVLDQCSYVNTDSYSIFGTVPDVSVQDDEMDLPLTAVADKLGLASTAVSYTGTGFSSAVLDVTAGTCSGSWGPIELYDQNLETRLSPSGGFTSRPQGTWYLGPLAPDTTYTLSYDYTDGVNNFSDSIELSPDDETPLHASIDLCSPPSP